MRQDLLCGVAAVLLAAAAVHAADTQPAQPAQTVRDAAERVGEAIKKEQAGQGMAALMEYSRILRDLSPEDTGKLDAMVKVVHGEGLIERTLRLRLGLACPEAHEKDGLVRCKRCGGTGKADGQTCPGCEGSGKVVCSRCGGTNLLLTLPTGYEAAALLTRYLAETREHLTAAEASFDKVTLAGDAGLADPTPLYAGRWDLVRAETWLAEAQRMRNLLDATRQADLAAIVKLDEDTQDKAAAALLTLCKAAAAEFDKRMKTFQDAKTARDARLAALRRMVELNGTADTFYRVTEVRYPRSFPPQKADAAAVAGRQKDLRDALDTLARRDALLADAVNAYRRKDYAACVGTLERLTKYLNAAEMSDCDALCQKAVTRKFAELMGRARFYALANGQDCGGPTELDAAAFVATGLALWDRAYKKVSDDLADLDRKADDRLKRIQSGFTSGGHWPVERRRAELNIKQLGKMARFMNDFNNKAVQAADRQRIPRMIDEVRRLEDHRLDIERKFYAAPDTPTPTPGTGGTGTGG